MKISILHGWPPRSPTLIEAQSSSSIDARPQSKQQWDRPCLWARDGLWPMLLFFHFIRKFVHLGFPGYKMFPFIMIPLGPQQCGMPLSDGHHRHFVHKAWLFACCSLYISTPTVQRPRLTVHPRRQPGGRDRSTLISPRDSENPWV